jgi:hypothetical protein
MGGPTVASLPLPGRTALRFCRGSIGKDPRNAPAIAPLFDPPALDSMMCAFSLMAVLMLEAGEVCGGSVPLIGLALGVFLQRVQAEVR